jgi:predicted RNase H-like HicB family nuclease
MRFYVGILDGSARTWGVRIPDFPGVHGGGKTPVDAIADTMSALREVGEIMVSEDTPLPLARTLEEIVADPEAAPNVNAGEAAVMIPLLVDESRPVKVSG